MGRIKAALRNLALLGLIVVLLPLLAAIWSVSTAIAVFYGCLVAYVPHGYFTLRVAFTAPRVKPLHANMLLLRAEAGKIVFSMALFALLFSLQPEVQAPAVFVGVVAMLAAQIVASVFLAKHLAVD